MREILFRGKRTKSREWVYGFYCRSTTKDSEYVIIRNITDMQPYPVIPETVGQFTGLTDKNGKKIFEGDILQKWDVDYDKCIELNYIYDEEPMNATKKDVATMGRFPVYWLRNESFGYEGDDLESPNDWEIIGNIHDNPELLKGGQQCTKQSS